MLVVTISAPELPEPVDLELPGDVCVERLLPGLIAALQLPPGSYRLVHRSRLLAPEQTLGDAQVLMGDSLALLAECQDDPPVSELAGAAEPVRLTDLVAPRATSLPPDRTGKTIAIWSGPAGGTGRTTLALALALLLAGRVGEAVLLALAEPALSAYLRLPRTPNASAFFETGGLRAAVQRVSWERKGAEIAALAVILGPARPGEGVAEAERVVELVAAARAAYPLVLLDLPALTPGGNPWCLGPLAQATDLLQVARPTTVGVAATVEALAALRDLGGDVQAHLVLVRWGEGELTRPDFVRAVRELWGNCPAVAAEVPFLPSLPAALERGEMPREVEYIRALEGVMAAIGT
ncbi:MAG: hypothetical protein JW900_00300 [Anaerolineae bacterium]|nr:hypothetical protein [Anaerolineae bacterium]